MSNVPSVCGNKCDAKGVAMPLLKLILPMTFLFSVIPLSFCDSVQIILHCPATYGIAVPEAVMTSLCSFILTYL